MVLRTRLRTSQPSMATRIVGVMGPGATATPEECRTAERLTGRSTVLT